MDYITRYTEKGVKEDLEKKMVFMTNGNTS